MLCPWYCLVSFCFWICPTIDCFESKLFLLYKYSSYGVYAMYSAINITIPLYPPSCERVRSARIIRCSALALLSSCDLRSVVMSIVLTQLQLRAKHPARRQWSANLIRDTSKHTYHPPLRGTLGWFSRFPSCCKTMRLRLDNQRMGSAKCNHRVKKSPPKKVSTSTLHCTSPFQLRNTKNTETTKLPRFS